MACGTPSGLGVMKNAVPGTRAGGCAPMASIKGSSAMASFFRILNSSLRPAFHEVMRVKIIMPMSKGAQPPSGIFIKLAPSNAKSIVRNTLSATPTFSLLQPHIL